MYRLCSISLLSLCLGLFIDLRGAASPELPLWHSTRFEASVADASTPDRFFLPLGNEIDLLTDGVNLMTYLGEQAHLEPWHTLHPPLSLGEANKGRLMYGYKMKSAFGLWVMESEDSYTSYEVALTLFALNALVRRAHPDGPDLMVLDIAQENGGRFKPHRSHQNGGDVDLRYFLKKTPPNDHEKRYVHASKLDLERTWTFLQLVAHYDLSELIFMDHRLQKVLYEYGRDRLDMTDRELQRFLSWPVKGRRRNALVQHISNHYHHMHIRIRQKTSTEWRALKLSEADEHHLAYLKNRTGFFEYIVQPGQTLGAIAAFNRVRLRDLLKWNEMTPSTIIRPGQVLKVWR